MKIVIDFREKTLFDSCEILIQYTDIFKGTVIEYGNLEIGDIIIQEDEKELVIIERKSVSDLVASIKDGRYKEQSYRLNGSPHENHNIIYLIEGSNFGSNKQMIYSSMFSLNYYKGFSVFRSDSVKESAYIILNMLLKLQKEKKKPYYPKETSEIEEEVNYCTMVKKKKNENITPDNFAEIVLCQIPYVNSVTAIAIMKEYKTLDNLVENIKSDEACLDKITYVTEKNQKRKIGKNSIKNIILFLSHKSETKI